MVKQKKILVNWEDLKSIKIAEKQKFNLENKGYNYIKTIREGLNKDLIIFENGN